MRGSISSIALEFVQSIPVEAAISGEIQLPFFDQPLNVEIGLGLDGDFTFALGSDEPLTIPDVLELTVESLGFEVEDGLFTAKLSGEVKPLFPGFDWPGFKVEELSIDAEGNVNFDGGWIDLRDQYSFDFHGFQLEITQLGFGKSDDGGKWIGFSGGLNLVEGLTAGASVEGLRITWYDDGDTKVTFEGVGVEFEVPDVLHFQGEVSYRELPDDVHRFDGEIKLELITLDLEIDAQLVVGYDAAAGYPFFAIYLDVELPAGIPLWSTGLALYGMAGLFALQMKPDKKPDEEWYGIEPGAGWYKRDPIGVGELAKWGNERLALALGAGVTIGTLTDNGFIFSGKLLLVISFPGPVLLIEGKANLLRERSRLDEEPIFRALAVLDCHEGTFLIGLDVQFKYDEEDGRVIDIRGGSEAYFSMSDPGAWHLYLGEREPKEKRIRAEIISFIEANSYLMVDTDQLAMGAWIGIEKRWTFGPVRLVLEAWIEGNAIINWKPAHFSGDLWLHGAFELKIFGFGLALSADARFACDVFDPYHILVELSYEVDLPSPLPDCGGSIELEWGPEPVMPPLPLPLQEVAVEHFADTASWLLPRNALLLPNYERDGFRQDPETSPEDVALLTPDAIEAFIPFVPMDCRPHITFSRPISDDAAIVEGRSNHDPEWERIGDPEKGEGPLRVRYRLQAIEFHKFVTDTETGSGTWNLVGRKASVYNAEDECWEPEGISSEFDTIYGTWAPIPNPIPILDSDDESVAQTKLWLWSKTPFDYTRHGGHSWSDWFTDHFEDYPCPSEPPPDGTLWVDFEALPIGLALASPWQHPDEPRPRFYWDTPQPPTVVRMEHTVADRRQAVYMGNRGEPRRARVTIYLHEPAKRVRLYFHEDGQQVEATAYDRYGSIILGPVPFDGDLVDLNGEAERRQIAYFELVGTSQTFIYAIGMTYGALAPAWEEVEAELFRLQNGLSRWSDEDYVLEPYTVYRLAIMTAIDYEGEAELSGKRGTYEQTEYAFFRTSGPPGLSHLSLSPETVNIEESARRTQGGDLLTIDNTGRIGEITEDEVAGLDPAGQQLVLKSALDTLVPYVAQTIPPTVPDEGEKPLLPRPVYRAYDVGVLLKEGNNYVELMYRLARRDLGLYLFDNNSRPVRDAEGRLIVLNNHWGRREEVTLTESAERWLTMISTATCIPENEVEVLPAQTLTSAAEGQVLEPDTTYEARLLPLLLHEDFSAHLGQSTSGPGAQIGDWLVHDDGTNEGPSSWQVDGHETISGEIDRVAGSDVYLGGSPDLSEVTPGVDVLHAFDLSDAPRPAYAYRIAGVDDSLKSVTVHGEPDPALGGRACEIPAWSTVNQSSNIWGGERGRDGVAKPGTRLVLADREDGNDPDPPSQWTDYRFSLRLRSTDDDAIGVTFRHQEDAGHHYRYSVNREHGYRRLVRVRGSVYALLAEDDYAYELDRDYLVTVEVGGASIRVYQDGELVFAVTDDERYVIDRGSVGLYSWANVSAHFRDIRVDDLRPTAPVYRFQFTTSKYANFFHHLHSFQDETWPVVLTGELPDTAEALALDEARTQPTESESRSYECIMEAIPGQSTHPIPAQVEVSRILREGSDPSGDEPPLAFLLQSPEPIDWTRTELRLEASTLWSPNFELPGIVKLTHVTFANGDRGAETVSLLLREACDLTGWRVECHGMPAGEGEPTGLSEEWRVYYAFDDEERLPAGTQITIFGSTTTGDVGPEGGVLRRYVAVAGRRLSAEGSQLRVVMPNGQVVHKRHFVSPAAYHPVPARVLRKADGTGFFILPEGTDDSFDASRYQLHLHFRRRHLEDEDESWKLSQAGYDGPEDVVLVIPR